MKRVCQDRVLPGEPAAGRRLEELAGWVARLERGAGGVLAAGIAAGAGGLLVGLMLGLTRAAPG